MDALDGFLGNCSCIQFVDKLVTEHPHLVLLSIVGVLSDEPVCLREFNTLVEVWKVLINFNLGTREAETILLKSLFEELLG